MKSKKGKTKVFFIPALETEKKMRQMKTKILEIHSINYTTMTKILKSISKLWKNKLKKEQETEEHIYLLEEKLKIIEQNNDKPSFIYSGKKEFILETKYVWFSQKRQPMSFLGFNITNWGSK